MTSPVDRVAVQAAWESVVAAQQMLVDARLTLSAALGVELHRMIGAAPLMVLPHERVTARLADGVQLSLGRGPLGYWVEMVVAAESAGSINGQADLWVEGVSIVSRLSNRLVREIEEMPPLKGKHEVRREGKALRRDLERARDALLSWLRTPT